MHANQAWISHVHCLAGPATNLNTQIDVLYICYRLFAQNLVNNIWTYISISTITKAATISWFVNRGHPNRNPGDHILNVWTHLELALGQ